MVLTCCVNFCAVGIPLMVSSFVMVLAFALQLTGVASPMWFDFTYSTGTSVGTSGYQGLWTQCTIATDVVCCGTVDDYYKNNGGVPGKP